MLAFSRTWEGKTVTAAVNAGGAPEALSLPWPSRDLLSGERFAGEVSLPPMTARLLFPEGNGGQADIT